MKPSYLVRVWNTKTNHYSTLAAYSTEDQADFALDTLEKRFPKLAREFYNIYIALDKNIEDVISYHKVKLEELERVYSR